MARNSIEMRNDLRRRVLIGLLGCAVVGVVWANFGRHHRKQKLREVEGTILDIDVASRTASLEFTHPKSGQLFTVSGILPVHCDIQIDGQPAKLTDLRVGETARVGGTFDSAKRVTCNWVHVWRQSDMASSPPAATQNVGDR